MKTTSTLLLTIGLLLFQFVGYANKEKVVVGYFANWQMYARGGVVVPESIDYSNYTILNYSFFSTDTAGNIGGVDPWADTLLLRGRIDWSKPQPAYYPNTSLIDFAHLWGVKVLPVIGGWTLSSTFPKMAASEKSRANFAHNCVNLIRKYQFDGIDIDWEYPTYEPHGGTPADKQNFTLLMKTIRDSIDAYGKSIDQKMLLMAAVGANKSNFEGIEYDKIKDILDYINLMTYDYNGAWNKEANHSSPLYSKAEDNVGSLDWSFRTLTQKYGVPAEKINVGTGFYARTLRCVSEVYEEGHCGVDKKMFPVYEGNPVYWRVMEEAHRYEQKWDEAAQMSYMVSKADSSFISYENEKVVRMKAEYVMKNKAAGMIIWEISGDYITANKQSFVIKKTPLATEIRDVFGLTPGKRIKKKY